MSIVNHEIAEKVLDGIISVHGTRRNLDASSDERRCVIVTPEDLETYAKEFSYNVGRVSDGKNIFFPESTIYTRIPVNIHMIEQNVSPLAEEYVMTIEEAAKQRRSSLQVWVDGYKMPDSEIKFYPTRSNVDVFIPHKYLSKLSSHEIIVEKKMYDEYPYIHLYYSKTSNQSFRVMLDDEQLRAVNAIRGSIEKNFQIYVNKKLYNSSRRLGYYNNSIEITLSVELTDSEVEIVCDPYTTFYFPVQSPRYGDEKNVYEIPETYIDSIHGPISRFSCAFFTNGLRVMNTRMSQKGRLHFEFDSESYANNSLAFYLSDRNLIVDTNRILYGSDYSMYNFIGTNAVTRALHTTISGNRFIDEGAGKSFDISVVKSFGTPTAKIYLPDNIDFNNDGHQRIRIGLYTTRDVGNGKFHVDTNLTEVSEEDFTVDNTVNPVEVTITAPSAYMADGTVTHGKLFITSWYTWDEVLNNYATLFERTTVEDILSKYESVYDNEVKTADMLKDRPYLMRTFLENYGYKTYNNTISYNGTDAYVYLGVPDTIDVSKGANYDITVNNKHIPIDKVRIIKKDVTDVFEIEGKNFDKGENIISIQVIDNMPVEYFKYKPDEVQILDGTPILQIRGFTHIGHREDNIIILEKCDSSDESIYMFVTEQNVGYKVFKDWKFAPYNEEDNEVNIIFNRVPEHDFIVYNKNFSQHISYVKPTIQSVTDVVIPLYMGNAKDPIPFIPRGKVYVYCGADKFIEGADYFIKTPEDDPSVAGSYIVMKRIVLPGAKIDIYFSNYKTENIYKKIGYFWNNKYGLFYLNDLKFPASLKYLNIYVNQQKLTEKDVDILSDKLIRVHSLFVPMYDLVVESAFTEDSWELQPYINLYEPDNFEKYLARLFIGADPNATASDLEGAEDINEVYNSFVDTVDSVNKRPNPTAREDEWCPPGIGPHDEGNVTSGNDINTSVIVGDMYVVGADNGKVASCALDNVKCTWTPCYASDPRFDGAAFSDGKETNNEDLMSSILYHGYIIFGSRNGNLYAFGTESGMWFDKESLPMLNIDKTWPKDCSINGFVFDQESDSLIMYGDNGNVDRYNWKRQGWAGVYDDPNKLYEDSIAVSGVIGNIYTAFIIRKLPYSLLIVLGEKGKAASCYLNCDVPNTWINGNGNIINSEGGKVAPSIYSDGKIRKNSTIRSHCEYFGYKVLVGDDGIVTYFNYPNFVDSDGLNICDLEGNNSLKHHMNDVIAFDERMMVLGGQDGKISHYEGEKMKWHDCDSGLGITSDGTIMQHNTINTMQLSSGKTHYIIFAGDNGIICSYNVKVHEQPYRYDPYKSRFLVWYTTPGNAEIIATWDIPEKISRMFNMLLESNVGSEDIILRHGDDDLMVDVSMMDEDAYPWTEERINRYIAHFIQDLPDGDYSLDEVYDIYMKSKARYMLYERDLPLLACGNPVDTEEDLLITRKVDE